MRLDHNCDEQYWLSESGPNYQSGCCVAKLLGVVIDQKWLLTYNEGILLLSGAKGAIG